MPPSIESPIGEVVRGMRRYIGANAALLVSAGVGAAVFVALITASADVYEDVTNANGVSGLDGPALDLGLSLRTPAGERWVTAFSNLGGMGPMVFMTLTLPDRSHVRDLAATVDLAVDDDRSVRLAHLHQRRQDRDRPCSPAARGSCPAL